MKRATDGPGIDAASWREIVNDAFERGDVETLELAERAGVVHPGIDTAGLLVLRAFALEWRAGCREAEDAWSLALDAFESLPNPDDLPADLAWELLERSKTDGPHDAEDRVIGHLARVSPDELYRRLEMYGQSFEYSPILAHDSCVLADGFMAAGRRAEAARALMDRLHVYGDDGETWLRLGAVCESLDGSVYTPWDDDQGDGMITARQAYERAIEHGDEEVRRLARERLELM